MKKAEQKALLGAIQTEQCYEIAPGLVGFWCKNPEALFASALKMTKVMRQNEWEDFLTGVGVIYYSESYHKQSGRGWIYPNNCLDMFFGEREINDVDSWANLVDAIAYQQNVTAKVLRYSNLCTTIARNEEDAEIRAITYFVGTLLRKFASQVFDNLNIIRESLGPELMASFEYWFRKMVAEKAVVFAMGEIPRVNAFLKHNQHFSDVRADKYMKEKDFVENAIKSIKNGLIKLREEIKTVKSGDLPAI